MREPLRDPWQSTVLSYVKYNFVNTKREAFSVTNYDVDACSGISCALLYTVLACFYRRYYEHVEFIIEPTLYLSLL
jgi:hypothetical protein